MENEEILCLLENFEGVWARVAAVPDDVEVMLPAPAQCSAVAPQQPLSPYQPRWFCVF